MKTVERAHMPSKLWERIKLSENYAKALGQIDERLIYWPKFLIHKCKQRMTRLAQVALRARKLMKEEERMGEKIVGKLAPKVKRREATRERKALAAAKVERQIEKELIERLRSGAYGEQPLNVEEGIWKKVLRGLEKGGQAERDVDMDDEEDEDMDEDMEEEEGEVEYVSGDEELEMEDDLEDIEDWLGSGASDFEEDDDEEDSEDEDDSEDEEEAPKGGKPDGKRKRPAAPAAKPRKREFFQVYHQLCYNKILTYPRRSACRDRVRGGAGDSSLSQGVGVLISFGIKRCNAFMISHHFYGSDFFFLVFVYNGLLVCCRSDWNIQKFRVAITYSVQIVELFCVSEAVEFSKGKLRRSFYVESQVDSM